MSSAEIRDLAARVAASDEMSDSAKAMVLHELADMERKASERERLASPDPAQAAALHQLEDAMVQCKSVGLTAGQIGEAAAMTLVELAG